MKKKRKSKLKDLEEQLVQLRKIYATTKRDLDDVERESRLRSVDLARLEVANTGHLAKISKYQKDLTDLHYKRKIEREVFKNWITGA